jgi:phenylacetate-CoA ligase
MSDAGPAPDAPSSLLDLLPEYAPGDAVALTDAERWPVLSESGARALASVREHPAAPDWVHRTGDRLDAEDLVALGALAAELAAWPRGADPSAVSASAGGEPAWVAELVDRVHRTVPRYRRLVRSRVVDLAAPPRLTDVAPLSRADLAGGPGGGVTDLVPVDVPLDRLVEGSSSGSTGSALVVPLHPRTVAAELVLLRELLRRLGVVWEPEPGRAALLSVVDQELAFTYASVLSAFGEAPMARVNLDARAWRRPGDRERFLADADPQVLSSSPWPLLALADLDLDLRPLAVVSGAAALTAGARGRLAARWGAPVLDLYGLRETGPVAVSTDGGPHVLVPRRVHVEVLGADGRPVPDGTRGEVTVTVDENPYLPLLRYRTGDHAALVRTPGGPALVDLEGRSPVRLRGPGGGWTGSVGVTQVLQTHGLVGWHVHQHADGRVDLTALGGDPAAAASSVRRLLRRPVEVREVRTTSELGSGKDRRFSSDVEGAG